MQGLRLAFENSKRNSFISEESPSPLEPPQPTLSLLPKPSPASSRLEHLRSLDAHVAAAVDRLIEVHIVQLEGRR